MKQLDFSLYEIHWLISLLDCEFTGLPGYPEVISDDIIWDTPTAVEIRKKLMEKYETT